jgi:hypothetical protein
MEDITIALKKAKAAGGTGEVDCPSGVKGVRPLLGYRSKGERSPVETEPLPYVSLSAAHLRSQHAAAFDSGSRVTRYYDMLRNQLVNAGEEKHPLVIAVVAPTAGCGATVTAVNLAFSFIRMRASVLIVDANSREPAVGRVLGLPAIASSPDESEFSSGVLTAVEVGGNRAHVLRTTGEGETRRVNAWPIATQIEDAKRKLNPSVVILDVSPMLVADETIPLVLDADAVVLVLAARKSKLSDLEVCKTYLGAKKGVQVVLNKSGKHGL